MFDTATSRRSFIASAMAGSAALLAACAGNSAATQGTAAAAPKPVILVVSFGTSYASSRHATIGAIESDIRAAFPEFAGFECFAAYFFKC